MIRPEAAAVLLRWRDAFIGTALIALGLYWFTKTFGLLSWVGAALTLIGALIGFAGLQRARFAKTQQGAGIVDVTEGQITYFGPNTGGVIALDNITKISLIYQQNEQLWKLEQPAQPALFIPIGATGAERLFDAFTQLQNFQIEPMLQLLAQRLNTPQTIWQKDYFLDPKNYIH